MEACRLADRRSDDEERDTSRERLHSRGHCGGTRPRPVAVVDRARGPTERREDQYDRRDEIDPALAATNRRAGVHEHEQSRESHDYAEHDASPRAAAARTGPVE